MVLQQAIKVNAEDAKALYYLGNFWYDKRQYIEAIDCWKRSIAIDDDFPTVHRNLGLAFFNQLNDAESALAEMEKAFSLNREDARVFMELDQLYKLLNYPVVKRLFYFMKYPDLLLQRDDLYLEKITLLNQLGEYSEAKDLLAARKFHPWEGGEGKVIAQYLTAHVELAKRAILEGDCDKALEYLMATEQYPYNLGEGKLFGCQENDIYYLKGVACEQIGETANANNYFQLATQGISEPVQAVFYNDPQPDKIFYQGLAWLKLGETGKANTIFNRLCSFGEAHLQDEIKIDYFAVSLPDLLVFDVDLNEKNRLHCYYLIALGKLGLGMYAEANLFNVILKMNPNHAGAGVHKSMISFLQRVKHTDHQKNILTNINKE
jgi:hypothetical protein